MDSPPRTPYQLPTRPVDDATLAETWASYRQGLAMLASRPDGMERLNGLLTEVSARIEAENRNLLSQMLSEYASSQDRVVQRSTERVAPSPSASRGSTQASPPPAPWELLSASRRLGPRLAQKLTIAAARREARR